MWDGQAGRGSPHQVEPAGAPESWSPAQAEAPAQEVPAAVGECSASPALNQSRLDVDKGLAQLLCGLRRVFYLILWLTGINDAAPYGALC